MTVLDQAVRFSHPALQQFLCLAWFHHHAEGRRNRRSVRAAASARVAFIQPNELNRLEFLRRQRADSDVRRRHRRAEQRNDAASAQV